MKAGTLTLVIGAFALVTEFFTLMAILDSNRVERETVWTGIIVTPAGGRAPAELGLTPGHNVVWRERK